MTTFQTNFSEDKTSYSISTKYCCAFAANAFALTYIPFRVILSYDHVETVIELCRRLLAAEACVVMFDSIT